MILFESTTSSILILKSNSDFGHYAFFILRVKTMVFMSLSFSPLHLHLICWWTISEEERAAKQSEVNLLMDEVERAQTRLLSLEREKVQSNVLYLYLILLDLSHFSAIFIWILLLHLSFEFQCSLSILWWLFNSINSIVPSWKK